jgi:serine/threonine protein kinase
LSRLEGIVTMPTPNQRISEYVLDARIGGGAFGEVWRARHHVWTDQLVAIKIPIDPQYVRNLQREGAAIHGLVHPNIVRAIGFDPYADPPYLTMEYIPGTSLRPLIQERTLSIENVVAIMRQVLSGLIYAHANGVVHRDIKPENILVHERFSSDGFAAEGVVKVTDFGLGRAATKTQVGSIAYSASMNDEMGREIAGTLDYMSPEQRQGAEVDGRADIYACGVVLYEMLTGERPAGTELPSGLNESVPGYLDEVFKRSYARLDKRFASVEEFLKALQPGPPPIPPGVRPLPEQGGAARRTVPCPTCNGKGVPPGAEWTFCDHCRGRGRMRSTVVNSQQEIEIECPKCGGRGTQPPEKCPTCRGGGRVTDEAGSPNSQDSLTCPQCRRPVEGSDQFCMHCGVQLVATVRRCPRCGAYPDGSDRFCIFCGEGLGAPVRMA